MTVLKPSDAMLEKILDLAVAIQQVPAPTFEEMQRAQFVQTHFQHAGLTEVRLDEMGNLFAKRPGGQFKFPLMYLINADPIFDLENQSCFERLQYTRRARFFSLLNAMNEVLAIQADIVDGAAGADAWGQFAVIDAFIEDQDSAGSRSAQKLVGRYENGIDGGVFVADRFRIHVDFDVRCASGVIKTGNSTVLVQKT